MKCLSYSVFGYGKAREENCFDFHSYMRGLGICLRMNRLLYPGWVSIIHTDSTTFEAFKPYFVAITESESVEVVTCPDAPLCKAMLWRMKPVFDKRFTHVICRDVDSPATYREAQAVQEWVSRGTKAAHAITDSISHTIPMLGGLIGFMPVHFSSRTGIYTWEEMISRSPFEFDYKGSDQDFLNAVIYPKFAQQGIDSITQHYVLGMPNTFLSDYHNSIPDILLDIPNSEEMKESNSICGHCGASGFYETSTFKFLRKHWDKFTDILEAERLHPSIFYWTKED